MSTPQPAVTQPIAAPVNNNLVNNPFLQAAPIFNNQPATPVVENNPVNSLNFSNSAPQTTTVVEPEVEEVVTEDTQPAPDWLTPKVFKGSME